MNAAIQKVFQQYVSNFMDNVAEKYNIDKTQLEEMWKETQKKKLVKKTTKRERNANKKKRPPSAYILFCSDRRPIIKEKNPTASTTEITRLLGQEWTNADDDTKKQYKDQHDLLVMQFQQEAEEEEAVVASEDDNQAEAEDAEEAAVSADTDNDEEDNAPKKRKKKAKKEKSIDIPDDLSSEREKKLYIHFHGFLIDDLRKMCKQNNLALKSKKRDDMIKALLTHRIHLEDGDDVSNYD